MSVANVLVCGLENSLAAQLEGLLAGLNEVNATHRGLRDADLVFCGTERRSLDRVLRALEKTRRHVPVVVVSRDADVSSWLDALEAGAADYLPAPFERKQLDWILQNQLSGRHSEPVH